MSHDFHHLAMYVNDLRKAEDFYRDVFGMGVLFREVETSDGEWYTLRSGTGWDEAEAAGVEIAMVALQRDGFTLAVFEGEPQPGTVVEIGISVATDEVDEIDRRLPDDATRLHHEHGEVYFADPFGFRWNVTPMGTRFMSNAEIDSRWLDI
jgi:catechol 2,3-dioxygenase-like lactoylglutathione lyase family enzyme